MARDYESDGAHGVVTWVQLTLLWPADSETLAALTAFVLERHSKVVEK
jgi:hypothetical protein